MTDFARIIPPTLMLIIASGIAVRGMIAHRAGRPTSVPIAALRLPWTLVVAAGLAWLSVVSLAAAEGTGWALIGYSVLALATLLLIMAHMLIVRARILRGWTRYEALEMHRHVDHH